MWHHQGGFCWKGMMGIGQQIASSADSTFKSLKTYGHAHTHILHSVTNEKIQGVEAVLPKSSEVKQLETC